LILCASHGALFERDGGLCIAGPCAGKRLIAVPVRIEGDYVLLGDDVDPADLLSRTERR
jgi:nitrite reductase/ring-hydroxylating ferredoxin subunit